VKEGTVLFILALIVIKNYDVLSSSMMTRTVVNNLHVFARQCARNSPIQQEEEIHHDAEAGT